jgi:6-phosphofructokinase
MPPMQADRVLATRPGSACVRHIDEGVHGLMVAARGEGTEEVPLEEVAGRQRRYRSTIRGSPPPDLWRSGSATEHPPVA